MNNSLPTALLQEGYLMRNALLEDLAELADVQVVVAYDVRVPKTAHKGFQWLAVDDTMALTDWLCTHQHDFDVVWLIAPETAHILAFWTDFFSQQGKLLCSSDAQTARLCADKLATLALLQQAGIACVPSFAYDADMAIDQQQPWVLKVNDSVGCDQVYYLTDASHWQTVGGLLAPDKQYIVQPYISGQSLSLSCVFYQGQAYLICCNQQQLHLQAQQFSLTACEVNVHTDQWAKYQLLCQTIAHCIPQLFGYVGIDFMQTESGALLILEINPRLTSSYVGIRPALGLNIAEQVLGLLQQRPPPLKAAHGFSFTVNLNHDSL